MNLNKAIEYLSIAFLIFVGLALAYLGCIWVFVPEIQIEKLGLIAPTIPSMSLLRSIIGSGLLTFSIMVFLFLYNREAWAKPLLLFAVLLFVARCLSLLVDGTHDRMVLYAVLEALIILAVLFLSRTFLRRSRLIESKGD